MQDLWHQKQPNYQKRFINNAVGFFLHQSTPIFYAHDLYKSGQSINIRCNIMYFSKRSGIVLKSFIVDHALCESDIVSMLKKRSSLPSILKLKMLFNGKDFYSSMLNYCDLLDTRLDFDQVLEKDDIKKSARFKYAKSLTLTKVMHSCVKQFINYLPYDVIYLLRRHNYFSVEFFNYLYAKNSKKLQLFRRDAMQSHGWIFGLTSLNDKDLISYIDDGKDVGGFIRKRYGVNRSVTNFLHGLNANHWKLLGSEFYISRGGSTPYLIFFLNFIESALKLFPDIKATQRWLRFFDQVDREFRVFLPSKSFLNLTNKDFFSIFSKQLLSCWRKDRSVDKLHQLSISILSNSIIDYFRFLKWNDIDYDKSMTINQAYNFSKLWHEKIFEIDQLRDEVYEEYGFMGADLLKWSAILPKKKLAKNLYIVELISQSELKEEGSRLKHCVGGYASTCAFHNHHIFSVRNDNNESISTLEIHFAKKDSSIEPKIVQHRGFQNSQPNNEVKELVSNWFSNNEQLLVERYEQCQKDCHNRLRAYENSKIKNQQLEAEVSKEFRKRLLLKFSKCFPKSVDK